jgi:hypothetical protein
VGDCYSHTSNKVTNLTLVRYLFYPYIARKLVVCLVALMVSNLTSKSPPSYRRILVTCCEDSNARCGNIYSSTNVGAFFFFFNFNFLFTSQHPPCVLGEGGRERERREVALGYFMQFHGDVLCGKRVKEWRKRVYFPRILWCSSPFLFFFF